MQSGTPTAAADDEVARLAATATSGGSTPHPGAVPLTLTQIASGLTYGRWWSPGVFTYSIPAAGATWLTYGPNEEPFVGFVGLTADQAIRFRTAMTAWDRLIAPDFTETVDGVTPGTVRIAFSSYDDLSDSWGYAYSAPIAGRSAPAYAGDIWVNAEYVTDDFFYGSYGYSSLIHEIGHTLGLKHPFEAPIIPAAYDNYRYTQMSYTDNPDYLVMGFVRTASGGVGVTYGEMYPTTPMVLDIAAIQSLYGADPDTAAGDDVYRFETDQPFLFSIYDAGGNDTIDVSSMRRASLVDLNPGAYSSIGYYSAEDQEADAIDRFGPYYADFIRDQFEDETPYTFADNLGIAFSTVIENAIGGGGDDILGGNKVANRLTGGAGNDLLTGRGGNDTIEGGAGLDIVAFAGASADFSWTKAGGGWTVKDLRTASPDGVDTLTGVEMLIFSDKTVTLDTTIVIGTDAADTLSGKGEVYGLAGDDRLTGQGAADFLDGGAGVDTAVFASHARDYAWWSNVDGTWTVKDLRTGAPDGTDTLRDIERIQFLDRTVKLDGLTTVETLTVAFENVLMHAPLSTADQAFISGLEADINKGRPMISALDEIVQRADATSAVASMAYAFFTGSTPSRGGFEYLVAAGGPNPNSLDSPYYQSFSLENRYINFAVNLGKLGAGQAQFAADYGGLSLSEATRKAYQVIYGTAPDDAKLKALLDASFQVAGQTLTRADYFATYGGDGREGIGTKAAMVGWLLTEAVKADVGTFALANYSYFADLTDGAAYAVDIVKAYGYPDFAYPAADDVAPTLVKSTPADDASGVAGHTNIVLTFSEAVQAGQGAIEIHKASGGALEDLIDIGDPLQVSINGAVVTVNLAHDLRPGDYYILLGRGVIGDLAGNSFAGVTSPTALNFSARSAASPAGEIALVGQAEEAGAV